MSGDRINQKAGNHATQIGKAEIEVHSSTPPLFSVEALPNELMVSLVTQWVTYLSACLFLGIFPAFSLCALIVMQIFPFTFGVHAIYGLVMGRKHENPRIVRLSIAAGLSALAWWIFFLVSSALFLLLAGIMKLLIQMKVIPTPIP